MLNAYVISWKLSTTCSTNMLGISLVLYHILGRSATQQIDPITMESGSCEVEDEKELIFFKFRVTNYSINNCTQGKAFDLRTMTTL